MRIVERLLYRITANLPVRLIQLESGPYLERYYLGELFGATFYLHRFVSSDSERRFHNHPWRWGRSLVLCGAYIEEVVTDLCPHAGPSGCLIEARSVRWWNRVNGNHFHRISKAESGTWTLFFHGPRVFVNGQPKGWGFIERRGHSGEKEYIDGRWTPYETTAFKPYPGAHEPWWLYAPKGRESERELIGGAT